MIPSQFKGLFGNRCTHQVKQTNEWAPSSLAHHCLWKWSIVGCEGSVVVRTAKDFAKLLMSGMFGVWSRTTYVYITTECFVREPPRTIFFLAGGGTSLRGPADATRHRRAEIKVCFLSSSYLRHFPTSTLERGSSTTKHSMF